MLAILTLIALLAFIFYWARRLAKSKGAAQAAAKQPSAADAWIVREVAAITARKLSLEKDDVHKTLSGNPDPDHVSSIERAVAKVEVVYERMVAAQIEARVEVAFEDGTTQKSARTVGWSDLPADIRDELGRTGASRVHRAWPLPWAR